MKNDNMEQVYLLDDVFLSSFKSFKFSKWIDVIKEMIGRCIQNDYRTLGIVSPTLCKNKWNNSPWIDKTCWLFRVKSFTIRVWIGHVILGEIDLCRLLYYIFFLFLIYLRWCSVINCRVQSFFVVDSTLSKLVLLDIFL